MNYTYCAQSEEAFFRLRTTNLDIIHLLILVDGSGYALDCSRLR